jgi:DNA-binding NarL/FixJ family response regulator
MGAITSLSAVTSTAGGSSNVGQEQQQQSQPQQSTIASDTVQLTEAQQVYQLYNQGMQVSQIASSLSLSVAAVNSYLNISNSGS